MAHGGQQRDDDEDGRCAHAGLLRTLLLLLWLSRQHVDVTTVIENAMSGRGQINGDGRGK